MNDCAIKIEGLSKAYRLGVEDARAETLVEAAVNFAKAPWRNLQRLRRLDTFSSEQDSPDILWALRDVTFEVGVGEVVGFVGRNGAGKSTLLKVLSRITEPTEGRIEVRGRVSSLLEVGTGFHPELTGRENIYMNGTILGMRKAEIDRKFDEIVDFSGVERFLDTPVKRYSSGMKVRLAFSVAAHLEPELLIVDEVLAVGDAEFQKKCLGKMQDVATGGRTVLFVSHNMGAVQRLCSRAIALRHGRVVDDGPSADVVRRYLANLAGQRSDGFARDNPDRKCSGELWLTSGYLVNEAGEPTETILSGESIGFRFAYEAEQELGDLALTITIYDTSGIAVTSINTGLTAFKISKPGRSGILQCDIPRNPFAIGDYRASIAVHSHGRQIDLIPAAISFSVIDSVFFPSARVPDRQYCTVYVDHRWSLVQAEEAVIAGAATFSQ